MYLMYINMEIENPRAKWSFTKHGCYGWVPPEACESVVSSSALAASLVPWVTGFGSGMGKN
jgi:hypothetical protein